MLPKNIAKVDAEQTEFGLVGVWNLESLSRGPVDSVLVGPQPTHLALREEVAVGTVEAIVSPTVAFVGFFIQYSLLPVIVGEELFVKVKSLDPYPSRWFDRMSLDYPKLGKRWCPQTWTKEKATQLVSVRFIRGLAAIV